jgi:two-component system phosphate regulon response regulator PhoB/two-component system alkaline phosphatase synthesis response regulator PhoP
MNELVAVIEDEVDIVELVSIHLKKSGFKVESFSNASRFYDYLELTMPDLVILDLMLPDVDGIEVCKFLRGSNEYSNIPIIMLTARDEEIDKILGLELGADDYVTKPFSPRELIARIRAVLRRYGKSQEDSILDIGDKLKIDLQKYEVYVDGKPVDLTTTEFNILKILSQNIGKVFSREQLLSQLWGGEKIVVSRTVDVHIKNLRDKLCSKGQHIKNIRGVGYKLDL